MKANIWKGKKGKRLSLRGTGKKKERRRHSKSERTPGLNGKRTRRDQRRRRQKKSFTTKRGGETELLDNSLTAGKNDLQSGKRQLKDRGRCVNE